MIFTVNIISSSGISLHFKFIFIFSHYKRMSVQLFNKYAESQPFHIYYQMNLINNDTDNPRPPIRFTYNESRNNPYLLAPDNYYLSIVRFHIQSPTLPVFIPRVVTGQANPNLTPYIITLTYVYSGTTYTSGTSGQIIYVPYDSTIPAPSTFVSPGATLLDLTSPYYYIYSYQAWVSMINTAFTNAYNQLNTVVVAAGGTLPSAYAPFMSIDPNNLTCTISADVAGYSTSLTGGTVTTAPIKIFWNTPLYILYNNFTWLYNGPTAVNDLDAQLICYNMYNTNLFTVTVTVSPSVTYSALQMYQEGQTATLLNPVQSIVFTTSILPVYLENIGIPAISGSANLYNIGNNANVIPVITDFQVPFTALNTYKPDIQYTPSGEYRLIDLNGSSPYQNINIDVQWRDVYGAYHDFTLGSGCSGSMKIMFRRKDYSNVSQVNVPDHHVNYQPNQ
jgi:hypothetical protein